MSRTFHRTVLGLALSIVASAPVLPQDGLFDEGNVEEVPLGGVRVLGSAIHVRPDPLSPKEELIRLTTGKEGDVGSVWFEQPVPLGPLPLRLEFDLFVKSASADPPDGLAVNFQFESDLALEGRGGDGVGACFEPGREHLSLVFDQRDDGSLDPETSCDLARGPRTCDFEVHRNSCPGDELPLASSSALGEDGPDLVALGMDRRKLRLAVEYIPPGVVEEPSEGHIRVSVEPAGAVRDGWEQTFPARLVFDDAGPRGPAAWLGLAGSSASADTAFEVENLRVVVVPETPSGDWNRSIEAVAITPSDEDGLFDLHAFVRLDPGTDEIPPRLDTEVEFRVDGVPVGAATIASEADEESLESALLAGIKLEGGVTVEIHARPADGAAPEIDSFDDASRHVFGGVEHCWDRGLSSFTIVENDDESFDVSVDVDLTTTYDGELDLSSRIVLLVDGKPAASDHAVGDQLTLDPCPSGCGGPCAVGPDGEAGGVCEIQNEDLYCACSSYSYASAHFRGIELEPGARVTARLVPIGLELPELPGLRKNDSISTTLPIPSFGLPHRGLDGSHVDISGDKITIDVSPGCRTGEGTDPSNCLPRFPDVDFELAYVCGEGGCTSADGVKPLDLDGFLFVCRCDDNGEIIYASCILWSHPWSGNSRPTPVAGPDGLLYLCVEDEEAQESSCTPWPENARPVAGPDGLPWFCAEDEETGEVLCAPWLLPVEPMAGPVAGPDGLIYICVRDENGEETACIPVPADVKPAQGIDGLLYLCHEDDVTGERECIPWSHPEKSRAEPVVGPDGLVYLCVEDKETQTSECIPWYEEVDVVEGPNGFLWLCAEDERAQQSICIPWLPGTEPSVGPEGNLRLCRNGNCEPSAGVGIDFGRPESIEVCFEDALDARETPEGAFLGVDVLSPEGRLLGRETARDAGDVFRVEADFSPIGTEGYHLVAVKDGQVVGEAESGGPRYTLDQDFAPECVRSAIVEGDLCIMFCWDDTPRPVSVRLGDDVFEADCVLLISVGAEPLEAGDVGKIELRFADTGPRTIASESFTAFGGRRHRASGRVRPVSPNLIVMESDSRTDLGSKLQVQLTPPASAWSVGFDPSYEMVEGSRLGVGVSTIGDEDGKIQDEFVSFAHDGSGIVVHAEFSPFPGNHFSSRFFSEASVVAEYEDQRAPSALSLDGSARFSDWFVIIDSGSQESDEIRFRAVLSGDQEISVEGATVIADAFELVAEIPRKKGVPDGALAFDSFELTVSGIPELAIVSEESVPFVPPEEDGFLRGDCNGDGELNISDPIFDLESLFGTGRASGCLEACDANDDTEHNISDAIYSLYYLFADGAAPGAPFPDCGADPTPDGGLACEDPGCD